MDSKLNKTGMLLLCATPIGNLGDISARVLEALNEADLIAAEDTRNSMKLLNHFDIHTPMTSYHEFNKIEKADELIAKMKTGMKIALITDAGTPAISDPGEVLVKKCQEAGIITTSLPGPAACITALTLSGLSTRRFCFEGFLPSEKSDKKGRRELLSELRTESRTIIMYEAPHRLRRTLDELYEYLGDRNIAVCRELTKKFETVIPTTIGAAVELYKTEEPRGEYVLVIEGKSREELKAEQQKEWQSLSVWEHMEYYQNQGMSQKEAMKAVAADRGVTKRDIYAMIMK